MPILNEYLSNKLKHTVVKCVELPTEHVNLISAFNDQSKSVKKQALLEVNIGSTQLDQVVLLSAQLLTKVILGIHFLISVDKKNQLDVTFCILYFSSDSCSTCFGQPCAHHQELTTA